MSDNTQPSESKERSEDNNTSESKRSEDNNTKKRSEGNTERLKEWADNLVNNAASGGKVSFHVFMVC